MCDNPHLEEVEFLVSGFLVEVQLLVKSPQKLHPLASCWGHCGHWTSWTIMILMIMAKIMLSLIVDDDADRDRATCTWLYLLLWLWRNLDKPSCTCFRTWPPSVPAFDNHQRNPPRCPEKFWCEYIIIFDSLLVFFLFTVLTQTYFAFKLMICSGVK